MTTRIEAPALPANGHSPASATTAPVVDSTEVFCPVPQRRVSLHGEPALQRAGALGTAGPGEDVDTAPRYLRNIRWSSISSPTVTSGSARQLVVAPWDARATDQLPCATGTPAPALSYATSAMTPASGRKGTEVLSHLKCTKNNSTHVPKHEHACTLAAIPLVLPVLHRSRRESGFSDEKRCVAH